MAPLLKRRSKKSGTPPGSLIYTGESADLTTHISLILYNDAEYIERHPSTIEEAFQLMNADFKTWIHFKGISDPQLIETLGKKFNLHPLMLEDIMNPTQRSKLDDYKSTIYIATGLLYFANGGDPHIDDDQLSMIIGPNYILTFLEKETEALQIIQKRLEKPASKMRNRGTDYLAYAILDIIVDGYFIILEKMDHSLEELEDELFHSPTSKTLRKIQIIKREMAVLRRTVWPMREVVNNFRKSESSLISESTRVYAYDVYDHTIQSIETIESFRDITSGMLDIYLSTINQKMNEIMKVLTVVATIFVPLTFITSLYGMNFDYMPELHSPYGYPFVLLGMFIISCGMLWFFRIKRWI